MSFSLLSEFADVVWVIAGAVAVGLGQDLRRRYRYARSRRTAARELDEIRRPSESRVEPDRSLDPEARQPATGLRFPYLYVTSVEIGAVRGFEQASLRLRFPYEGTSARYPNVNLLLGDNGSGKSTVLRSIALAALSPVLSDSGYVPYHMVRHGFGEGWVRALFAFGEGDGKHRDLPKSHLTIERKRDLEVVRTTVGGPYWDALYIEASPAFFVAGYGVNRRTPDVDSRRSSARFDTSDRRRRFGRVASLFDEESPLAPLRLWFPDLTRQRQSEFLELFERLMPKGARFTGTFLESDPLFSWGETNVPLGAMSDGFRAYIGWLSDLLFQLVSVTPDHLKVTEIGGIVLVDEVDLLLHPSWQRIVVPAVSDLLPNLQFVFTSHSPLVAGTLHAENIFLVRESEQAGASEVVQLHSGLHGLGVDQILRSSYFELKSPRSPDAERELDRLGTAAAGGDLDAAARYLEILERGLEDDGEDSR